METLFVLFVLSYFIAMLVNVHFLEKYLRIIVQELEAIKEKEQHGRP